MKIRGKDLPTDIAASHHTSLSSPRSHTHTHCTYVINRLHRQTKTLLCTAVGLPEDDIVIFQPKVRTLTVPV